jgi:PPK2 family polyphosphate:nucleotide phosphotransferase
MKYRKQIKESARLAEPYCVRKGERFRLKDYHPGGTGEVKNKEQSLRIIENRAGLLSNLQEKLYAQDRWALLLVIQAMDAAGKDGVIKHVMSGVNPQGCEVHAFKTPSAEELNHDYLWRAHRCVPERGKIGIFNRSYYEEVLVLRVHPELIENEGFSPKLGHDKSFWKERYQSIVEQEDHLHRNDTRIVKIFLHLSKEEQRKRFLARIDEPDKNWKFSLSDIHERKYWDDYQKAYQTCLHATSTRHAPWYVVPADDKENARVIVSSILLDTLESLKLSYPRVSPKRRAELLSFRKLLVK